MSQGIIMSKIKIICLNGITVVKCPYCNCTVRVEDLEENGEKVADVIVGICPQCSEEIVIKQ